MTGVCVLAATSRPDLLDAALLRPGRLDRLIYCGFPDASERGHILHALARRLRLHGDVDLEGVGQRCEGYSGADLSALLSEAQLAAVHERLDLDSAEVSLTVLLYLVQITTCAWCQVTFKSYLITLHTLLHATLFLLISA